MTTPKILQFARVSCNSAGRICNTVLCSSRQLVTRHSVGLTHKYTKKKLIHQIITYLCNIKSVITFSSYAYINEIVTVGMIKMITESSTLCTLSIL